MARIEPVLREAIVQDRAAWAKLWRKFMTEQHDQGSSILPTDQTFRQYLDIFHSYTIGSLFGTVTLALVDGEPVGVAMGGETPWTAGFETTRGNAAILWGVYVLPEYRRQGLSQRLLAAAARRGAELGFDTVLSEVLPLEALTGNAKKIGTTPSTTNVWMDLKETALGG